MCPFCIAPSAEHKPPKSEMAFSRAAGTGDFRGSLELVFSKKDVEPLTFGVLRIVLRICP